jgi:hypothetical protein
VGGEQAHDRTGGDALDARVADLRRARLEVVHAGTETFPLAPRIRALAAERLLADLEPLR